MNFSLESALPILQRTPAVIRSLLADLPREWTHSNYGQDTWTAHEILGHLIFGERTDWIPRARHILAHRDATPFDPFDRAGHFPLCQQHTTAELLDIFERERAQSLADLRAMNLTSAMLATPGRHPALGPVTLSHLLATWVAHDLNHIAQICKAMAFQHKEAVGPWQQYLSILAPPNPR